MIVFLDTNVYDGAKYIFDSGKLDILKKLVKDGEIIILYTNINKNEAMQHINTEIKDKVNKYNRSVRTQMEELNKDKICSIEELNVEEIVNKVKEKFQNFLLLNGVEEVPLNPLDADKLIADYFSKKPPFETKKPNEFKDAIMINAIKNYQKRIKEQICIVSSDEGFRNSFCGDNFKIFQYLGQFLRYYRNNKVIECIQNAIEEGKLNEPLEEYMNEQEIWIDHHIEASWKNFKIIEYNYDLLTTQEKGKNIYAFISCEVKFLIDIKYLDENLSYYDKEENKYMIANYSEDREKHKLNFDLKAYCDIIEDNDDEIMLQKFEITEDGYNINKIDLDEYTLICSEYLNNSLDENCELEYCSQCGKTIYTDTCYQDYVGNPVCENCMKVDTNGDICPKCGRKVPYEYMMSGFCDKCFNDID